MFRKAEKRVNDMFNKGEFDDDFINIKFKPIVTKNILPYQTLHVMNLVAALMKSNDACVIDGSSTGTGKTYTAIATCAQLGLSPFIVCPRSIIGNWKSVCDIFNVRPLAIVNYETLKNGKEYDDDMNKTKSIYVEKKDKSYNWTFDKNTIIIFDEAHKCKNKNSLNGKLMASVKGKTRVMLLSATLCDKPTDFLLFGLIVGFYDTFKKGKNWINGILVDDRNKFGKHESSLSKHIYPKHGSKMSLEDLGTAIPQNVVSTECYTIKQIYADKINKEYEAIKKALKTTSGAGDLTAIIQARQKIEEHKSPILLELCEKYIEINHSVVIFVNFVKTMDHLKKALDDKDIKYSHIVGGQTFEDRTKQIEEFQNNNNKVILAMMQTGGESINLHDLSGNHPRVSLISPSFSSIELVQALGRIYRTGVKSRVLQKLIFCDNTYETTICQVIKKKIGFLNKLSDDDLLRF